MKKVYQTKNLIGQEVLIEIQHTSSNSKTGNAVQVWIIPKEWVTTGNMSNDSASCMDCIHSKRENKTCYVRKGMSEMGLRSKVRSLQKGCEILPISDIYQEIPKLRGKFIRFGAFGEPVLLGKDVVREMCAVSSGWTGYTHQWHVPHYKWADEYFMASVDNVHLNRKAQNWGWRTFMTLEKSEEKVDGMALCPASKEAGRKVTCIDCKLCKGNTSKAKSIQIYKH
jgi:hypothetical protein